MKKFSQNIARIGTENAFAVGPEIQSWQDKGYDIVKLNIGEPGCAISEEASAAAIASIKKGETHYTAAQGNETLLKEIAQYMTATRGINFQSRDICMTTGGKPVISGTIFILVNPGDEVIYPTPCYPIYESICQFAGAKARPLLLQEDKGFRFDLEELEKMVSKKTKLLILNSPSNPTGGVLEKDDLKFIARLAIKHDFYVLSDEIYSRIVFGKDFNHVRFKDNSFPLSVSIASFKGMDERTIILDGFSKTYAMTGLRLGFAASKNKEFMAKFITYAINIWSCLPQPCMAAAEAVLGKNQKEAQLEIDGYRQKRDAAVKMLNRIKGIRCHNPVSSFYLFPNVTEVCRKLRLKDAEALRKYLLAYDKKNKKGVAVLAREHFGKRLKHEKEEYIRLSIAGKMEDVVEGVKRIGQAVLS